MANDDDYDAEEASEGGGFRWMSAVVVLLAVAGFFGLAWYAYKNGGEAVDEKDVELIKADTTPVKEAPANPGGMQIPNQDKTVYGLISGKADKPVVERILPAPEEPMTRSGDTETWMSDKVKNETAGEDHSATTFPSSPPSDENPDTIPPKEQFNPSKIRADKENKPQVAATAAPVTPVTAVPTPAPVTPAAPQPKPAVQAQPAPTSTHASAPTPAPVPKPATTATAKPATPDSDSDTQEQPAPQVSAKPPEKAVDIAPSGVRVQLGSYRSQVEAESNWVRIGKEFSDDIASRQHYILRADLGGKGVYYRLQVAPFASSREAEQFCLDFVSAGQACILAKGK